MTVLDAKPRLQFTFAALFSVGCLGQGVTNSNPGIEAGFQSLSESELHRACAFMSACAGGSISDCLSNARALSVSSLGAAAAGGRQWRRWLLEATQATTCDNLRAAGGIEVSTGCEVSRCEGTVAHYCGREQGGRYDCAQDGDVCLQMGDIPMCAIQLADDSAVAGCNGNVAINVDGGLVVRTQCPTGTTCLVIDSVGAVCQEARTPCSNRGEVRCDGNVAVECRWMGEDRSEETRFDCSQYEGTCDVNAGLNLAYCRRPESVSSRTTGCAGTTAFFEARPLYVGAFDCATLGFVCEDDSSGVRCSAP